MRAVNCDIQGQVDKTISNQNLSFHLTSLLGKSYKPVM